MSKENKDLGDAGFTQLHLRRIFGGWQAAPRLDPPTFADRFCCCGLRSLKVNS